MLPTIHFGLYCNIMEYSLACDSKVCYRVMWSYGCVLNCLNGGKLVFCVVCMTRKTSNVRVNFDVVSLSL